MSVLFPKQDVTFKGVGEGGGGHVPPYFQKWGGGGHKWVCAPPHFLAKQMF